MKNFYSAGKVLFNVITATKNASRDDLESACQHLQETAHQYPDRPAITFEGETITWRQFNQKVNQAANALREQGVSEGVCVSLLMENRIEFLVNLSGIFRLGAIAALINNNLRGPQLIHCLTTTDAKILIYGSELESVVAEVIDECQLEQGKRFLRVANGNDLTAPNWAIDFSGAASDAPETEPPALPSIKRKQAAVYLFTSGTTGLPRAAVMSHGRLLGSARMGELVGAKLTCDDRVYNCLPMYHGTGMIVGFLGCVVTGASMFLRRKFSASRFLDEVREQGCNRHRRSLLRQYRRSQR